MRTTRYTRLHAARFALAPLFIGIAGMASQALAQPVYRCQRLSAPQGELPGGVPQAINRQGDVVGSYEYMVRKWDSTGQARPIERETFAMGFTMGGINDEGYATGFAGHISGPQPEGTTGYVWSPDGTGSRLTKYQDQHTAGLGINSAGVVAGWTSYENRPMKATLWDSGQQKMLPPLQPGKNAMAQQINDKGVVVGTSDLTIDGAVTTHAVKWVNRKVKDLGVLPGHKSSRALALNNQGVIVGYSHNDLVSQPVAWVGGVIQPLMADSSEGEARRVNRRGEIIGWTKTLGPTYWPQPGAEPVSINSLVAADHPCTTEEGAVIALNDVGDISARGSIVGYGFGTRPWGDTYPASFRLVPLTAP